MNQKKPSFIDVDNLVGQIQPDDVLNFYGVTDVELHRSGTEVRLRCVLNCGKECETGDRAIAMRTDQPGKPWKCHQYEYGKAGNLVGFMDMLKPGDNAGGRPRSQRFKDVAADLQAIAGGEQPPAAAPAKTSGQAKPTEEPKVNVPLAKSDKPAARALVNLDEKFLRVPDESMNKHAASYIRNRPYLTPEVMEKWRMGYLPHDTGSDKSGGTMRGKIVYPMLSELGDVLAWFGRDPQFEEKHRKWVQAGRDPKKEPRKHHFVKGFFKGQELFGQQRRRLDEPGYREAIADLGLLVVEGPNDAIRLDALGVPAVALCSNRITETQARKLARGAEQLSGNLVTVMLDNDPEGEQGSKQTVYELAKLCQVRLAWSPGAFDGTLAGKQPESLTPDEWELVRATL